MNNYHGRVRRLEVCAVALTLALLSWRPDDCLGAEGRPVVVIVHPSVKDWAKLIAAQLERRQGGYHVPPFHALTEGQKLVRAKYRYKVGTSVAGLKDWNWALLIKKPTQTPLALDVPYVLLYRSPKTRKTTQLLNRTLRCSSVDQFTKDFGNDVPRNLWQVLGTRVAKRPGFPIEVADGPGGEKVVTVPLHNRWPFGVRVAVTSLLGRSPQYLDIMTARSGVRVVDNSVVTVLEPGQKHALVFRVADFKGVRPDRADVRVAVVDAGLAPAE